MGSPTPRLMARPEPSQSLTGGWSGAGWNWLENWRIGRRGSEVSDGGRWRQRLASSTSEPDRVRLSPVSVTETLSRLNPCGSLSAPIEISGVSNPR